MEQAAEKLPATELARRQPVDAARHVRPTRSFYANLFRAQIFCCANP
jgi:hypothetical protein